MSDKSRRKLLKSIAAGSGAIVAGKSLPELWSKPVVDSVMLPAHAQTSSGIYSVTNTRLSDASSPTQPDFDYIRVCAIVTGGIARVTFQPLYEGGSPPASASIPSADALRIGDIPTDGTPGDLVAQAANSCDNVARLSVSATISSIDENSLTLVVSRPRGNDIVRVVPSAASCVSFISCETP